MKLLTTTSTALATFALFVSSAPIPSFKGTLNKGDVGSVCFPFKMTCI